MWPNPKNPKSSNRGFTLIELVLVALIFPVLSLAIYANFSAGSRLWITLNKDVAEEDLSLFYRKAALDIENTLRYAPLPFEGEEKKVSFMAGIKTEPELGGDRGIGQVRYFYDPDKRTLFREEKNISQLHTDRPGRLSVLIDGVRSFDFYFFSKDKLDGQYKWNDIWEDEKSIPLAIRIEFEHVTQTGATGRYKKTFYVPVGGSSS